jgi:DNA adenine methylase
MKAPFPWFGGKARVSHLVWDRFGADVCNYVEPFAGSMAVLLMRPGGAGKNETVNDKNCYLANFWRALQQDPEQVATFADWPVNEADLHARHLWLVNQHAFQVRMKSDPDYFDARIAGWWVWGISQWIGSGWCSRPEWRGRFGGYRANRGVHQSSIHQKRPHLNKGGNGVHRCSQQIPDISGDSGASGRGVNAAYVRTDLYGYFDALAERLRRVRVCCGDWSRILGPSPTVKIGTTAVFLDPPYSAERDDVYSEDSMFLSHEVAEWAVGHGDNPRLRIALCGYEGEHSMPSSWVCIPWKANGGYGNQASQSRGRENAGKERIWFSPHCLTPERVEAAA